METHVTIMIGSNLAMRHSIIIINECVAASSKKRNKNCISTNISHPFGGNT